MTANLFTGKLVRLVTIDPDQHAEVIASWGKDSEYQRLLGSDICTLFTAKLMKEWWEKEEVGYEFMILTQTGDKPIGFLGLSGVNWSAGDAWVGIGIGERDYWGKGYGTEAFNLLLAFGFRELNLRRISLSVFEYNPRAIRSYEKLGFQQEGRQREWLNRGGKRWDLIFMGILRQEWEALQPTT